MVPVAVVLGLNLFAACADNDRASWHRLVRGCGAYGVAILVAAGLGAVLLTLATRRPGAWALAVPALPWLAADCGRFVGTHAMLGHVLTHTLPVRVPVMHPGELHATASDQGLLRVLAAQQSLALALALVVTHTEAFRPRAAAWPGRALLLAVVGIFLGTLHAPWRVFGAPSLDISYMTCALLALSLLLPPLLVAPLFQRVAREAPADRSPYRSAAPPEALPSLRRNPSLAVAGALLMPWLARGYTRGAVVTEGVWWSLSGRLSFLDGGNVREALLSFASRWDRYVLPVTAALALVALARGSDRRVLRVWVATLALLTCGEVCSLRELRRLHAALSPRPATAHVSTPGISWALRAATPVASRRSLHWERDGAETARDDDDSEWHIGPMVHVDPDMRGDVWRALLHRWRARSDDGLLTLAGIGSAPHLRWDNDPRQEVPLAAEPTQDALHALCEVADAPSMAGSLVVRVVDGASVELVDVAIGTTTRVALVDWRPGLLTRAAVVVPAGDEVTVTEVVRAAVRVSNGRVPVRLGW